jgi:hypothetical protein
MSAGSTTGFQVGRVFSEFAEFVNLLRGLVLSSKILDLKNFIE